MRRPIVLVPACQRQLGSHVWHMAQDKYLHAVLHGADIGRFLDTRSRNGLIYRQFLRDCGLDCREENML